MSAMLICCQGASCCSLTRNFKTSVLSQGSNPSQESFRLFPCRDVALGLFGKGSPKSVLGASLYRAAFVRHGACGGIRLQPICSLRLDDFSVGAYRARDARLCKVLLGASVAARVVLAFSSQNSHSSTSSHYGDHQHHSHEDEKHDHSQGSCDDEHSLSQSHEEYHAHALGCSDGHNHGHATSLNAVQKVVKTTALHLEKDEKPVPNDKPRKKPGKQKRAEVVEELRSGRSPLDILNSVTEWSPPVFWGVVDYLHAHRRMQEALEVFTWWKQQDGYRRCELHYTKFIRMLGQAQMPTAARALFVEMCEVGLRPSVATYTCLLQSYAERGQFEEAELILKDMVLSGDAKPNTVTYTGLIHAYGKHGMYDSMWRTFNRMKTHGVPADDFTYRTMIKAYARGGLFEKLQLTAKEMSRNDMFADSPTLNAVVQAYAAAGLIKEMEKHFEILSKYSFIPGHETVKAMVSAYVKNSLFFQLSVFVKRVGLRRRTVGNDLWNALLLSRAANFAMADLKMEFENMKYAGFFPDVTTCNIMALAYSRMKQFWELHQLVVTMQNNGIAPDLVTYGAVIDVFIEEDLRPKLLEELVEFRNLDVVAEVETDPVVFEVFGRGGFLLACQTLGRNMEGQAMEHQTYSQLIGYFLQSLSKRRRKPQRRVKV